MDEEGITTFVNPRACKILGYDADELIGRSMHEAIHHTYPDGRPYPKLDCKVYNCILENKPSQVDDEVFWSKSSKAIPIEYTVTPLIENKKIVGGVITFLDVTEKRKMKQQMDVISTIQNSYIKAEDKTIIFDDILSNLLEITESEYGFIGKIEHDLKGAPYLKTYAITNIAWDRASQDFYDKFSSSGLEFKNLKTLFGYTIRTGKVVISNNPSRDKRRGGLPHGHPVLRSYLGIPLIGLSGQLIAMYGLANREDGYSEDLVNELKPLTSAISNIVESSQHYALIEDVVKFDALTRLFNRQFTYIKLSELLEKHRMEKTRFCVLMLDLNNFKSVNDRYGSDVGDELLILFSKRISSLLKSSDFFARVGGDEFIVLVENTTKPSDIIEITACLNKANDTPYHVQKKTIFCGVTIGVACYPMAGKTREELLSHVSFALYDAKRKKESVGFYSKKTKRLFEEIMLLQSELKQAFFKKEFCVFYQPQVELSTGKIVGLEALLRWNHPRKGLLCPDGFITYLEDLGLSEALNTYVLENVLTEISALNLGYSLSVSVNISPQVSDFKGHIQDLVNIVKSKKAMLKENKLTFEFEITESSFILHNATSLNASLMQAKQQGIKCAIDDFGMEYSSINRLTQYKFDTVKIDKVFTQKLDKRNKKTSIAIIKALVQLSKDLNFKLIAEGPETETQSKTLIEVGCLYGQGFYFYKPMTFSHVINLLTK